VSPLTLHQPAQGYRFSLDACLLADFAPLDMQSPVIELGTGCGVVALLVARRFPHLRLVGVELQTSLVHMAARNVVENGVADRVEIVQADIRHLPFLFPAGVFGTVVCNPPYRRVGHGRLNAHPEKAIARHELAVTLTQVLEAARHLLRHHGVLVLIYHPSRLAELCVQLDAMRLCPRRMRFVHPAPDAEASMVLVEAVQGGGDALTVMQPLMIAGCGS